MKKRLWDLHIEWRARTTLRKRYCNSYCILGWRHARCRRMSSTRWNNGPFWKLKRLIIDWWICMGPGVKEVCSLQFSTWNLAFCWTFQLKINALADHEVPKELNDRIRMEKADIKLRLFHSLCLKCTVVLWGGESGLGWLEARGKQYVDIRRMLRSSMWRKVMRKGDGGYPRFLNVRQIGRTPKEYLKGQ